jgi:hypothetical protein
MTQPLFEDLDKLSAEALEQMTDEEYEQITMEYYYRLGGTDFDADFLRLYGR